ncbi:hypothetical protein ES332_A05G321800v1 [Gossypium tomentosum]|uniref:Uncharacterized protein n=1 Tax=Gossypium tomentosum TaxID=34277 RepID=A0A5D2QQ93_GOSTO|nr:hypothetical protein ES332_A05G321800v1 [Gossypium tomentosum]
MRKEQFPLMNSQLQGGKRYMLSETIQLDTMCFINMVYLLLNIEMEFSQADFDSLLVTEHTRKTSEVNYA